MIQATPGQSYIEINGAKVILPAPLQETMIWKEIVLVLLNPDSGRRNVFAFNSSGQRLWQIQEFPYAQVSSGYRMLDERNGEIYAIGMSTYFKIDPQTGSVSHSTTEK